MLAKLSFTFSLLLSSFIVFGGQPCLEMLQGASCRDIPVDSEAYRMCCSYMEPGAEEEKRAKALREQKQKAPTMGKEELFEALDEFIDKKYALKEKEGAGLTDEQLNKLATQINGLKHHNCLQKHRTLSRNKAIEILGTGSQNQAKKSLSAEDEDCVIHPDDQSRTCHGVRWEPVKENRLGESHDGAALLGGRKSLQDIESVLGEISTPSEYQVPYDRDSSRGISQ